MAVTKPHVLGPVIERIYPHDNLSVGPGTWIVADEPTATAQLVTAKLGLIVGPDGIEDSPTGTALVAGGANYYGLMNASVWKWMTMKMTE